MMSAGKLPSIQERPSCGDDILGAARSAYQEDDENRAADHVHHLSVRKRLPRPEAHAGTASCEPAQPHHEAALAFNTAASSSTLAPRGSMDRDAKEVSQDMVKEILFLIRHIIHGSPAELNQKYLPELFSGPAERARTARLVAGLKHLEWAVGDNDLSSDGYDEQNLCVVSEGLQKAASVATGLSEAGSERQVALIDKVFQRITLEERGDITDKIACLSKLVGEVKTSLHTQSEKNKKLQDLAREIKLEQQAAQSTLQSISDELDQLGAESAAASPVMRRGEKRALAAEFSAFLESVQQHSACIAQDMYAFSADVEKVAEGIRKREDACDGMRALKERVEELIRDYEDEGLEG